MKLEKLTEIIFKIFGESCSLVELVVFSFDFDIDVEQRSQVLTSK